MLTPFHYCAPHTLAEVSDQLLQAAPHGRMVAGGTDLLPNLERRRVLAQTVIALPPLAELRSVSGSLQAGLRLGALVTLVELTQAPLVGAHWPVLAQAATLMATPAVRSLATIGGNLCGGLPLADLVVVGLALDADVEIYGPAGTRRQPLSQFIAPWGVVQLAPGEILTAVYVPPVAGLAAYQRFSVRAAADVVLANVAVRRAGAEVRIVAGGHGPRPGRLWAAEAVVAGDGDIEAAAASAAEWACPADDARASRAYRQALVGVLVGRALRAVQEAA